MEFKPKIEDINNIDLTMQDKNKTAEEKIQYMLEYIDLNKHSFVSDFEREKCRIFFDRQINEFAAEIENQRGLLSEHVVDLTEEYQELKVNNKRFVDNLFSLIVYEFEDKEYYVKEKHLKDVIERYNTQPLKGGLHEE